MADKRVLAGVAVIAAGLGVWLATRGCGGRAAVDGVVGAREAPASGGGTPAPGTDTPDAPGEGARAGERAREAAIAGDVGAVATAPVDAGGGAASLDAGPTRDGPVAVDARGVDDRGQPDDGGLVDRRGRNDGLGAQLNREFMPLASECIDLAQARNPALTGTLILQLTLAPGDRGKAIVAAVKPRADNTIADPELLECIRESSFALDGLVSPYDFDLSMPIEPVAGDAATR